MAASENGLKGPWWLSKKKRDKCKNEFHDALHHNKLQLSKIRDLLDDGELNSSQEKINGHGTSTQRSDPQKDDTGSGADGDVSQGS